MGGLLAESDLIETILGCTGIDENDKVWWYKINKSIMHTMYMVYLIIYKYITYLHIK